MAGRGIAKASDEDFIRAILRGQLVLSVRRDADVHALPEAIALADEQA